VRAAKDTRRKLGAKLMKMQAYYMLRKADGLPCVVHMLRAVPPALSAAAARLHDEAVLQEVAYFAGATPAELGVLGPSVWLPLRKGGRAVASAALVAGAAYVAARIQVGRLEEQVGARGSPSTPGVSASKLVRASGRPAPWWELGTANLCGGKAHCRMPRAEGCGRGCCTVCCCTSEHGACAGCRPKVDELRATEEVRGLLRDETVREAVRLAADAAGPGATTGRVEDAFVAASAYRAPQRAMTCALLAVRCAALERELTRPGRETELRTWRACAAPSAYSVWLASPMAVKLSDGAFRVAMRMMFGLIVMSPTALRCRTKAGYEGKVCRLRGIKDFEAHAAVHPRAADQHALTCKCGGCQIHTHDDVVHASANTANSWGVRVLVESKRGLPSGMRMDNEAPEAGDPCEPLMADWTRRFQAGQVELSRAEDEKERKYNEAYQMMVTMRGAAFNEFGELGPHAMDVVNRLVAVGVRTSGSHPADLKTEMLARIGAAVLNGNAAAFAHFAEINGDRRGHAPTKLELKPAGQRWAAGVTGQLAGRGRRGRPRGSVRPGGLTTRAAAVAPRAEGVREEVAVQGGAAVRAGQALAGGSSTDSGSACHA
jgi:hypothetical protein